MLNEEVVHAAKELARVAGGTGEKIVFVACGDMDVKRPQILPQDCFVVIVVKGDSKFWNDAQSLVKRMSPSDEHQVRIYP